MTHARKRRRRKPPRDLLIPEKQAPAAGQGIAHGEPFDYCARPGQAELRRDGARFKVVVAHRRFGKTVFAVNELLRGATRVSLRAPRFAYVAPFYRQAKTYARDYLKHHRRRIV